MDDTEIHIMACHWADDEAFRLYGTDSIHDRHVLWPRWLELYSKALADYYHSTGRTKAGNCIC